MWYWNTRTYVASENIPFSNRTLWMLLMSVLDSVKWNITINENVSLTDYVPGIQLLDWYKLAKYRKNGNDITAFWHTVIWRCFVSLASFSYRSKFCVNIITDSGLMTIFFYKVLTRNLWMRNTTVWVLSNILKME